MNEFDYADSFTHKFIQTFSQYVLLFLLLRFLYYAYLEREFWRKENEDKLDLVKSKIAYGMHQDIGNDLNALQFKITNWHSKNGNIASPEYDQLQNSTKQIITKVNDIVWSLKTEKTNLPAIIDYLVNYAEDILGTTKMAFNYKVTSNIPKLKIDIETKKHIYLLFKEVLNNAIKHAKASEINVEISYIKRKLKISIADNGNGFNLNEINRGNGIDNMQNRIKKLNGNLYFLPKLPNGSIVQFELKIQNNIFA